MTQPHDFGGVSARGEPVGKAGHREIAVLGRRRGRSHCAGSRPTAIPRAACRETRLAARGGAGD